MATAAKKKVAHRSAMHNPPRSKFATAKKNTAARKKSSTSLAKRNPATPARKKSYRRNPSPTTNAFLAAIGGAFAIVAFDEAVARFMPSMSTAISIGSKFAAGWAIGTYGRKYLGQWASFAQGALWLVGAKHAFDAYLRPQLGGWLTSVPGTAAVVNQEPVQSPTGQMGTRLYLADGNSIDVFDGQSAYAN